MFVVIIVLAIATEPPVIHSVVFIHSVVLHTMMHVVVSVVSNEKLLRL